MARRLLVVALAALVVVVVVVVETDDVVRARARRDREEEGGEGDDEETPRHGCARDGPRQPRGDGARGFDARAGDEGATSSGSQRRRSAFV